MVSATASVKDPTKVRAGALGARKRWGDQPRVVRLDELTAEQRAVVLALIAAHKAANESTKKSAPAATAETLQEVRRVSVDRHQSE